MFSTFRRNKFQFKRLMIHVILAQIASYLTFVVFQTHVPRPEIVGQDLLSGLINLTYRFDNPYAGFPSLHVLTTVIVCWHAWLVAHYRVSSKTVFCTVYGGLIILSTLFVKQHVALDVLGGLIYAVVLWPTANYVAQRVKLAANRTN